MRKQRRSRNETFFAAGILSAYWGGFLAADGSVSRDGKTVNLELGLKDAEHLARFCRDTDFKGKPFQRMQRGKYWSTGVAVSSAESWTKDLYCRFNITPNKTLTLEPPSVVDDEALAFIIGYIDGDGSWSVRRANSQHGRLRLSIVGTYSVLTWIRNQLILAGCDTGKVHARPSPGSRAFQIEFTGHRAAAIGRRLALVECPRLERKWAVAMAGNLSQEKPRLRLVAMAVL